MPSRRLPTLLAAFTAMAACLGLAWQAAALAGQDVLFNRAMTEVSFWGRDNYQPTTATIGRTGQQIARLVARAPNNPEYLALQASYNIWQAHWNAGTEAGDQHLAQALKAQHQSLINRPAHPHSQAKMLEYQRRVRPAHQNG